MKKHLPLVACFLLAFGVYGHADPTAPGTQQGARGARGAILGEEGGASASLPRTTTFAQRVRATAFRLRDRLSEHHAARTQAARTQAARTQAGGDPTQVESEPEATERAEGYENFGESLFIEGEGDGIDIHPNDPRQGRLGDCYLVAAMVAIARTDPDQIREMIVDHGDGTYSVRLADVGWFWIDSVETVSADLPYATQGDEQRPVYARSADTATTEDGETAYELWPSLIEKAYAQYRGGYEEIAGGRVTDAMAFISGEDTTLTVMERDTTAEEVYEAISEALAAGNPVAIGTLKEPGDVAAEAGVVGNHAYVVWAEEDGRFRLYNPWGTRHPNRTLSAAELRAMISAVHVGNF